MRCPNGRAIRVGRVPINLQVGLLFAIVSTLWAQAPVDALTKYEKLNLPQSPGSVLVMYTPSAEQRALRYRQILAGAVKWYGEQLN